MPLIRHHVKEGSEVWTDVWAAYLELNKFGYVHRTVNHSKEFRNANRKCTNGLAG